MLSRKTARATATHPPCPRMPEGPLPVVTRPTAVTHQICGVGGYLVDVHWVNLVDAALDAVDELPENRSSSGVAVRDLHDLPTKLASRVALRRRGSPRAGDGTVPESRVPSPGRVSALAMLPAASVAGFYFAHPDPKYFNVGRIGPDQLKSWAERSESSLDAAERALAPLL